LDFYALFLAGRRRARRDASLISVCKIASIGIDADESWHPELDAFFEADYVLVGDVLDI